MDEQERLGLRLAGYEALIARYGLEVIPNAHRSFVASTGTHRIEIIDMPDRQIDRFIRFCSQNNGRLAARKRSRHFDMLTEDEIARMEQVIQAGYGGQPSRKL